VAAPTHYRLFAGSRCPVLSLTAYLTLSLSLLCSGVVLANPVPADDESLANGAFLYDLYCAGCHGVSTSEQGYGFNAGSELEQEYDFSDLIDEAQAQNALPGKDNAWPDWVEYPDWEPGDNESALKSEILYDLTAAIDDAYGIEPDSGSSSEYVAPQTDFFESLPSEQTIDSNGAGAFDPAPGVTNLASPYLYFYGTSEEDMFNSIAYGAGGAAMPGWQIELGSDEAIWDLVNYIRSYWGEEWLY
jgi:mono/diheme cytochrome c family protein